MSLNQLDAIYTQRQSYNTALADFLARETEKSWSYVCPDLAVLPTELLLLLKWNISLKS